MGLSRLGRSLELGFFLLSTLYLPWQSTAQTQQPIFINAGGSNHTDAQGNVWVSDELLKPMYINTGKTYSKILPIDGTDEDPLYQTERYDLSASPAMIWKIPVVNGMYEVKLHFAEVYAKASGVRVFDVYMEDVLIFDNLDIFSLVGGFTALVMDATVSVTDEELTIEFKHEIENPKISAIEIRPINDPGAPSFSPTSAPVTFPTSSAPSSVPSRAPSSAPSMSPMSAPVTSPEFTPIFINAGGETFDDAAGNRWVKDVETQYYNGIERTSSTTLPISGTLDDTLYQTERWDPPGNPELKYDIPVTDGFYDVYLHFAEIYNRAQSPGSRVFDVWVEGVLVIEGLDIFSRAGGYTALVESVLGVQVTDGTLTIEFGHDIENPKISGIEVHAASLVNPTDSPMTPGPATSGASEAPSMSPTRSPAPTQIPWIDLNESEGYTARHECSFVQAGDKFFMFGGRENATKLDIYDYATNSWTVGASPPEPFNHFQATLYEGLIWVIGAYKDNRFPNEELEENVHVYDPANNVWMEGPEIPWPRGGGGLVVHDDKFYLVGGNVAGHDGSFVPWFDSYVPDTGEWVTLADAPHSRDHFHAAVIDNKLYAIGGRRTIKGNTFGDTVAEVDVFDFNTEQWLTTGLPDNLPTPRAASAVAVFDGKIMVMGGESGTQSEAYDLVDALDVTTGLWEPLSPMNHRRHGTQAIVSGDGVYVAGGSPNQGGGNQKNMEAYNADAPEGKPSEAGELMAPNTVDIVIRKPQSVKIQHTGGNQGVFVESAVLTGPNASNFTISNKVTDRLLIPQGGELDYLIEFNGDVRDLKKNLPDQMAQLQVTHSGQQTLSVTLVGKLQ